jgi:hypothetical protein
MIDLLETPTNFFPPGILRIFVQLDVETSQEGVGQCGPCFRGQIERLL